VIDLAYEPRPQFVDFHQRHERNALMVCHRRMGKTVGCIGDLVVRALHTNKPNARFGYVAPFRQQAKEIAWTYLKSMTDGIRSEKPRESELRVKLENGAWITLYGADNPDALRGLYFDGLILDEFGDMKPSLMGEVIIPCLADRQGFMVLIGTAKGRNQFYDYMVRAKNDPAWFYKNQKASETGLIPDDELARMRETMGEAQYAQEMENDFDAALPGRYYTDLINDLQEQGRVVEDDLYDPEQAVHVAADVGLRDSTAWWFWQPRPDGLAIIDYYEKSGVHVDHYLEMLHGRGYQYAELWLPFDAKAKTLATRRSTMEQITIPSSVRPDLYDGGVVLPTRLVPKMAVQHGIDAVRMMLPKCYFSTHNESVVRGLDCLRSYRRQWHEHTQQFADQPLHDWASNGADGFRYLALVAKEGQGEMLDAPMPGFGTLGIGRGGSDQGYTLDQLFEDRDRDNWRSRVLRI
jgi:phage terminase large subunit